MLTLSQIRQAVIPLAEKYRLIKVDLFGSYANGRATEASDADFLVEFHDGTPSIFDVMGLREELTSALRRPVDVLVAPMPARNDGFALGEMVTLYEYER